MSKVFHRASPYNWSLIINLVNVLSKKMANVPKKAIPISGWEGIARFGIKPVRTSLPCVSEMRQYCVVNEAGGELLAEYWGVADLNLPPPETATTVGGEPAVGGVMLPTGAFWQIAEFALLRMGAVGIAYGDTRGMMGVFDQALFDHLRKNHRIKFNDAKHSIRPIEKSRYV
jgi:hypothetical protein